MTKRIMKMATRGWTTAGLVVCAFFAGMAVNALPSFNTFSDGERIYADDMNDNFTQIMEWARDQEQVAGYLTKDNGATVPFYRKIVTGVKGATVDSNTDSLPHGLGSYDIASQRRVVGCEVVVNYTGGATTALNLTAGSATAAWCDFTDTEVEVEWVTTTPQDGNYYVVIDYVRSW